MEMRLRRRRKQGGIAVLALAVAIALNGQALPAEASTAAAPAGQQADGQGFVTTAEQAIKSVKALGFVDTDGSKLRAIAVEYDRPIAAKAVSKDAFAIEDYGMTLSEKDLTQGSAPGAVEKVYVNDAPAVSAAGGTSSGRYVIIEVNTDYQLASVAKKYAAALAAGVKQVGSVESDKGLIVPAVEMVKYYDHVVIEGKKPNGQPKRDEYDLAREGTYTVGEMTIDYNKHQVLVRGENVHLTLSEFRIVALLGKFAGKVLTYDYIIKELWGPRAGGDNQILRVNMANIRRKIEKNPAEPEYLFTEVGVGYRMAENSEQ